MSDFVQTMRDWRRMCKAYTTDDDSCCEGCPVVDFREHGCGAIFEMEDADWKRYAETIMSWAAEHPEPNYPTWEEWLQTVGVMVNAGLNKELCSRQLMIEGVSAYAIPTRKVLDPIPADIAQKLGIEPKGDV